MEDLQSALGNRGLTVSNVPEKGRCLFTTKDFYPGLLSLALVLSCLFGIVKMEGFEMQGK